MIRSVKRCPEYVGGYREHCREAFDNDAILYGYPNRGEDMECENKTTGSVSGGGLSKKSSNRRNFLS